MDCAGCGLHSYTATLPGRLCLIPPLEHTLQTLQHSLRDEGRSYTIPAPGILQVDLDAGQMKELAIRLNGLLSTPELHDTKALVLPSDRNFTLADVAGVQSLYTWINRINGQWLVEMVKSRRTITHFQPIVSMKDPATLFAHECLMRGMEEDGSLVFPGHMYDVARMAGLIHFLDREARIRSIQDARAKNVDTALFINFLPTSIYDPAFCLRTTFNAVQEAGIEPSRIVFEVVESEKTEDVGHLAGILNFYRRSGFRVALDDLGAGYSSLNLLPRLKPDFVKLDMEMIRGVDQDPYKERILTTLLQMARDLGIATIAEGIETQGEWQWLSANGADYAQGYYISRPGPNPVNWRTIPAAQL